MARAIRVRGRLEGAPARRLLQQEDAPRRSSHGAHLCRASERAALARRQRVATPSSGSEHCAGAARAAEAEAREAVGRLHSGMSRRSRVCPSVRADAPADHGDAEDDRRDDHHDPDAWGQPHARGRKAVR